MMDEKRLYAFCARSTLFSALMLLSNEATREPRQVAALLNELVGDLVAHHTFVMNALAGESSPRGRCLYKVMDYYIRLCEYQDAARLMRDLIVARPIVVKLHEEQGDISVLNPEEYRQLQEVIEAWCQCAEQIDDELERLSHRSDGHCHLSA